MIHLWPALKPSSGISYDPKHAEFPSPLPSLFLGIVLTYLDPSVLAGSLVINTTVLKYSSNVSSALQDDSLWLGLCINILQHSHLDLQTESYSMFI